MVKGTSPGQTVRVLQAVEANATGIDPEAVHGRGIGLVDRHESKRADGQGRRPVRVTATPIYFRDHRQRQSMPEPEPEVIAYFYESRIVDGIGAGGDWSHEIRDSHPDRIGNIEYRNLQRLTSSEDVDVDVDPVGTLIEVETQNGMTTTTVQGGPENVDKDIDSVHDVVPLVPVPEDVGEGPEPEPVREKAGALYYREVDVDAPRYFRVQPTDDEAEQKREGESVTDARMYDVWQLDVAGKLQPVQYEKTPFAAPKYQ